MLIIIFIVYIFFTTTGMLLIKIGGADASAQITSKLVSIQFKPVLILGLAFYVISFLIYIYLVQKANLSYIIPVSAGIVNIIAVLMGVFILKEEIRIQSIIGIALVLVGVTLMSISKAKS